MSFIRSLAKSLVAGARECAKSFQDFEYARHKAYVEKHDANVVKKEKKAK